MNRLVLLRHGAPRAPSGTYTYGATDLPLLEDGVQDLKLAAARGVYPSPDGFTFVTSGMLRANQTLHAIYGDVPFSVIDDLREVNFGIFEMKSYEDLKTEPVYQDWLAGDWFRNVPPGGESFADSEARLLRGLNELLSRKDNTIWRPGRRTILTARQTYSRKREKTATHGSRNPAFGYEIDLVNHVYLPISG